MIEWHGRQFPVSMLDGAALPDAFVHEAGLLPHLHEDLAEIFPKHEHATTKAMKILQKTKVLRTSAPTSG
jgi:hypothetical protein